MISKNEFGFYELSGSEIPETFNNSMILIGGELTLRQGAEILARKVQARQLIACYGKLGDDHFRNANIRYSKASQGTDKDGKEYALLMFESGEYHNAKAVAGRPFVDSESPNIDLLVSCGSLANLYLGGLSIPKSEKLAGTYPSPPMYLDPEIYEALPEQEKLPNMIGAVRGAVLETDLYLGHTKRWFAKIDLASLDEYIRKFVKIFDRFGEGTPIWTSPFEIYFVSTGKNHPLDRWFGDFAKGSVFEIPTHITNFGPEQMLFEEFSSDLSDPRLYPHLTPHVTPMLKLVEICENMFKAVRVGSGVCAENVLDFMASRVKFAGN